MHHNIYLKFDTYFEWTNVQFVKHFYRNIISFPSLKIIFFGKKVEAERKFGAYTRSFLFFFFSSTFFLFFS